MGYGQELNNLRTLKIIASKDTIILDSLSVIPGSFVLMKGDEVIPASDYFLDEFTSKFFWKGSLVDSFGSMDSLSMVFRVYPMSFSKPRYLRDRRVLDKKDAKAGDVFLTERPSEKNSSLFGLEGLTRSGSISRGISIGNNQDAVVNSSLNLQIAGKIAGNIEILAAITDENIPVQAEGNTQQLQEFDRVFIQLNNDKHKLIAGDYDVRNPDGYFMRYFKKSQGGLYSYTETIQREGKAPLQVSGGLGAAVSRGKFARNVINGIESNQGPYRLRGAENELFIVVMSNSERVFIDGQKLDRGQDRDYIIDYNTAEVTFTTRRLINKDLRIVVEFQYADRNYARTLLTGFAAVKSEKLQAGINLYSEQDSKNQPLQQDLTAEDKAILAAAGDSLQLAFSTSGDSVAFNVNETLYARFDTTVNAILYSGVYVYSSNPDSAYFRVSFSNVGAGKGDYIAVDGVANGRIYKWIAPVNGVSQGSYAPITLLVSPKQRQMATGYINYAFTKNTKMGVELAASKDDINRFSTKDKRNDDGVAAKFFLDHRQALNKNRTDGWDFVASIQAEVNDEKFRPVEVYRNVEFSRDWNTGTLFSFDKELLSNVQVGLSSAKTGDMRYGFRSLFRSDTYRGLMHTLNGNIRPGKWTAKWDASLLSSDGPVFESSFLRHRDEVTRSFGSWIPGIRFEQERNKQLLTGRDSMSASSFHFRIADVFFTRPDSVKLSVKGGITRREDDGINGDRFVLATTADMAHFGIGWNKNQKQRVAFLVNYRNLKVVDTLYTQVNPEESATGRLDYSLNLGKGALSLSSFYEGGTGREPRRLYSFIEVTPGTGSYSWNDYNGDGVPQLNEFEIAVFSDQANYIRIFSTTDEYVKVFFNQFNAVVNFNPAALFSNQQKPFWTKFSLLSSVRFDNRITSEGGLDAWNPFPRSIADTVLLSTQSNSRHTLFFDRSSSKFAADISWQDQQTRQLLASGLETRGQEAYSTTIRWNITTWLGLQEKVEISDKSSQADAFTTRNFMIEGKENNTQINFQPGSTYRISLTYRYKEKENVAAEGFGEKAQLNDIGLEWRYNSIKKGLINAKFNLVQIGYNGDANTSIAFEMLEGLKEGQNLTWGVSIQRNLGSGLQLSFTYDGRKPAKTKMIHTGGAQVRAFF
jgi:hypothetical protein